MASRTRWRLLATLLALALLAAACGDGDDDADEVPATTTEAEPGDLTATTNPPADGATDSTETPAETEATEPATDDGSADDPQRIVSLSPTATEMLFAIGAGDQVIAVDDFSNFPPEAPITDLSGFQPNIEAIAEFEPDLVVVSFADDALLGGLEALGVSIVVLPAASTLEDTYSQIAELGAVTGQIDGAAAVAGQMRADIDEIVAGADSVAGLTYYHELDDTLFSVTSQTFIGEIYGLVGLTNVADAADPDGEAFGFPQLSAEFLVDADPDLIFLADTKCCGQNAETIAARPGWDGLSAVTNGTIIELDDDIASRWGPRVVDFLRVVVEETSAVVVAAG